jgi:hypothetical protein
MNRRKVGVNRSRHFAFHCTNARCAIDAALQSVAMRALLKTLF